MITLEQIRKDKEVRILLEKADEQLDVIGYTEHGDRHSTIVAKRASQILRELGYSTHRSQLAEIAGYLHDIGNVISRTNHAITSGLIAYKILGKYDIDMEDITEIIGAIGNHHEEEGEPISDICSAIIIADKSDVHVSRVRKPPHIDIDIHDRVNYAAKKSSLKIDKDKGVITLEILIEPDISTVMDYFEVFMTRMIMTKKAAMFLGKKFELVINGVKLA
ncbi:MAG: HD domain-containing protein [Acidobacteria bacterium]|nr:HD domain-containing protein [Acidobacteriota bacterium]